MQQTDLRTLLEQTLADAEDRLKLAITNLLTARDAALTARQDVEAYRQALEAASRGNGRPYVAPHLVTPADDMLGITNGHHPTKIINSPSSRITKRGLIRDAIRENPGLRSREVWEKIREQNPPIEVTMEDMHRTLGGLVMRKEVRRDSLGGLFLTEKAGAD